MKRLNIKHGVVKFIIIGLVSSLIGCQQVREVEIDEVLETVLSGENLAWVEGTSKDLRRFIQLNPNEVEAFVYYIPASSMGVEELLVVKVYDQSDFDEIKELLEQRISAQIERFESYKPENVGLLENYELKTVGDYLFFAVSTEVEELADRFHEVMRK